MRTPLLLVAATVAVGCGSSAGFDLRKESCDVDVTTLSRDLTHHLINGDGSGEFDYDPEGDYLAGVAGRYDLLTGDFAWTETGTDESYVDTIEVSGFGYANENGDLDVIGTRSRTDVRGIVSETQFRTERVGCSVEHRIRYTTSGAERERVEEGTYSPGVYEYGSTTGVDGYAYLIEGELLPDGTYSEAITYNSPDYKRSAEQIGDRTEDSYTLVYDDEIESSRVGTIVRAGTDVQFTNGTQDRDFRLEYSGRVEEWAYRIDYEGNGTGTVVVNGSTTCSLTYTNYQCRYDCGSGGRGDC